jgi:hypothetical protein
MTKHFKDIAFVIGDIAHELVGKHLTSILIFTILGTPSVVIAAAFIL